MDSNGNLNYAERRALKPGARVVYQTDHMTGERAGTVRRVCGGGGIVWVRRPGCNDTCVLATHYLRLADAPGLQAAGGVAAPKTGRDTGAGRNAPEGREEVSKEARAEIERLMAEIRAHMDGLGEAIAAMMEGGR